MTRPLDLFIQEAFEDLAKLPKDEVRMVVKLLNHQTTLFCNLANALKEEIDRVKPVSHADFMGEEES